VVVDIGVDVGGSGSGGGRSNGECAVEVDNTVGIE